MDATYRLEYYQKLTLKGWRWFWRMRCANNGEIMFQNTQGYNQRADCMKSITQARVAMNEARIVEVAS
jgi:uncharacterized protein YegP (UPF0339 family)